MKRKFSHIFTCSFLVKKFIKIIEKSIFFIRSNYHSFVCHISVSNKLTKQKKNIFKEKKGRMNEKK